MKKLFVVLIVFALASCDNNKATENKTSTDTTVINSSAVENVNGNLPDTTNSIKIDGGKPKAANPGDTL